MTPASDSLSFANRIHGTTRVLAVIGHPVAHSFSPAMQNAALAARGLDLCYVAFDVNPEAVGDAVRAVCALKMSGMNVTVPHKEAVIPFLDELSEEASRVGAVNTIQNVDGRLIGHNTDVYGILAALRETAGLATLPSTVAILGASGAARGVTYAVCSRPEVATVRLFNRTPEKAESLAREMSAWTAATLEAHPLTPDALREGLADAGLLINATSVGMHPYSDASPVPDGVGLHPGLVTYDIVFNPPVTRLMRQARAAGGRAYCGADMLVHQGARAFEIWTGLTPSIEVMKSVFTPAPEG